MVREVWRYLAVGIPLTAALAVFGPPAAALLAGGATIFVAAFFRDPTRAIPANPGHLLSPADGRVVDIADVAGEGGPARRISIFLSVFNVHVNRSPAAGRIAGIRYTPGRYLPAFRHKASDLNEQNLITLETDHGPVAVKQIAGLIARRIRCWKRPGDMVAQGERIGFITFGSRVDLFVPVEAEIRVAVGDRVYGGTSVLAVHRGREVT